MGDPDPTLAVYLVMNNDRDKKVLAAWPYCVANGDCSIAAVADITGLQEMVVETELDPTHCDIIRARVESALTRRP